MTRIGLDFDGTLVSCRERHTALMDALARPLGVDVPAAALWRLKRRGLNNADALRRLGVPGDAIERLLAGWTAQIERLPWLAFDRLLVKLPRLERMVCAGSSLHLLTARRSPPLLLQQLARLGMTNLFASIDVVDPDQAATSKAAALQRRGCAVFFGDSESDQRAATVAGVPFKAVSSGMRSAAFLRSQGCVDIRRRLDDYLADP